MKLYMSGIKDAATFGMMNTAGITRLLADTNDIDNIPEGYGEQAIDSGAYAAFKKGRVLNVPEFCSLASALREQRRPGFIIAPDVLGKPDATWANWQQCLDLGFDWLTPVWQWGAPYWQLSAYLDASPQVCIGGLVPLMRAKDEQMLSELATLCRQYPFHFHILGINWLKAIETVRDTAFSGDTSKMLDGGRYGHVVFINTRTGRLQQAPARAIPQYAELDRAGRIMLSAQELVRASESCLPGCPECGSTESVRVVKTDGGYECLGCQTPEHESWFRAA